MSATVVLVRHGRSRWNAAGIYQGQVGPGLDEAGHAQAKLVAEHLVQRFADVRLIARSDLERVVETAQPLEERLPSVPVVVDERLREIDLGSWAGRTHAEVVAADPAAVMWSSWEHDAPHGGESLSDFRPRTRAALTDLLAQVDDGTVVVVTHGGVIRMLVAAALNQSPADEARLAGVANGSVSVLSASARGLRLITYNETGHLASR